MGTSTIIRYLLGQRDAILAVARCRQSLWLGLFLVMTAGLAREYDQEDLLHEPWYLLLPLGASLVTATLLYALLWLVLRGWKTFPAAGGAYRSFLGLYWMTAPLAWLYAIPFEQFLSEGDAVRANLWLLAIVALWRVLLITRAASVFFEIPFWKAFFPVILFADTVLLILLAVMPKPIFAVMGGIQLSDAERTISEITFIVSALAMLIWPFAAIAVGEAIFHPPKPRDSAAHDPPPQPMHPSAWLPGVAAFLVGLALLPVTQPRQQLRWQVERDLYSGRIAQALSTMSRHDRADFPPYWDPPPHVTYGRNQPPIIEVMAALEAVEPPAWIRETYQNKFTNHFGHRWWDDAYWATLDQPHFDRHLTALEQLPVDFPNADRLIRSLEHELENPARSESQRDRIRKLVARHRASESR